MEDQTQLLQALYSEYLTKSIQLTEENARLRLELEAMKQAGETVDTETNS